MHKTEYTHINLQAFKELTFEDLEIQKEIIEAFFEILEEYKTVLHSELPNKNWQALFKATHKIKPNINMFGITELESIMQELEDNFRNEENLDSLEPMVGYSLDILKQVKTELENELKTIHNV